MIPIRTSETRERGAGLIEAAMLIGFVALICIVTMRSLGYRVGCLFVMTTAAFERQNGTLQDLRDHTPGYSANSGEYVMCHEILGQN